MGKMYNIFNTLVLADSISPRRKTAGAYPFN